MEMHDGKRRVFLRSAQVAHAEQYWNLVTTALKPYAQPYTQRLTWRMASRNFNVAVQLRGVESLIERSWVRSGAAGQGGAAGWHGEAEQG
jgi:hypothetical protein